MDLETIDGLAVNKAWQTKARSIDFPPDKDRLRDAIEMRRAILKGSKST